MVSVRPDLLDNRTRTHADGLAALVDDHDQRHGLSIATGYVNLGGLDHLAVTVTDGRGVRVLLGAAPDPGLGAELPLGRFELALANLSGERDLARFPPSRAAERLAAVEAWLRRPYVEVRRFLTQFLHGKAYLFGDADDARAALVTSANLTGAGMHRNLELGLVRYDPGPAGQAIEWFDRLWDAAEDFKADLLDLLFPDPGLLDPQTVYLRALLELYGEELGEAAAPDPVGVVSLAPFQRDGYERARRILADHHGVVYADGVGTGKTEIGLAFVEEYALRRGQHALVVAPKQLHRNWTDRLAQARLPAEVLSFQQLATDEQLAPDAAVARRHLASDRDTYRLIVVDEAHALRNPDTTWYRAMARLLGGERKDLVLLTATPVNNGLWDLYHLVMLFARHDRALAKRGVISLREVFLRAGANERDPENLDPDALFPVADAYSVRRDRRFIQQHYPDAHFADGTPVRFPTPHLATARYDLDAAHPDLVEHVSALIGAMTMARYRPSAYRLDSGESSAETTLGGLLQSGILKRLESCWAACLATVERMLAAHDAFLAAWDAGTVPSGASLSLVARAELGDAGLGEWVEDTLSQDPEALPVAAFRREYRDDVAADQVRLRAMRDLLAGLDAATDPKLALLREVLRDCPSQKVAVFATYGETVAYLDRHLTASDAGRQRVVVIGAETDPDARTAALARFCPATVVRPDYRPPDGEVDLLLATDVLSEGQNLQHAAAVVSYDMPWNPQRVVQRNGRVIRLRSPHDDVWLATMLPQPGDLDRLLSLEVTLRRKIRAASVYGMESGVLDDVDAELRSYASRLAAGDEGLLDEHVESDPAGFAGEERRADLLRAAAEGELARIRALPWGIGAAFRQGPTVPAAGPPGVFFACRTAVGQRYWRYVEADVVEDRDGTILRRIDPGTAPRDDPEGIDLEGTWRQAAASIVAEHNRRADPRFEQERIGPTQRAALAVLRDPTVTLPVGAEAAEEVLTAERGPLLRRALGEIVRLLAEAAISRDEAALRIVGIVEDAGLHSVPPLPRLEPITVDDIGVVCWLAVLPPTSA